MFPAHRTEGEVCSIPPCDLTARDVDGCRDARRAVHHRCRRCVSRSEPREPFVNSLVGPYRALERPSLAPMALRVAGGHIRGRPRGLSAAVWEEDRRRTTSQGLVADEMGAPDGVVRCAEAGLVTKGQDAVGVARQDGGSLGQVDQAQVGVCAA